MIFITNSPPPPIIAEPISYKISFFHKTQLSIIETKKWI